MVIADHYLGLEFLGDFFFMGRNLNLVLGIASFIALQRLVELRIAQRNREWALATGAQEFGARHYPLFFILHSGWLVGWVLEAGQQGGQLSRVWRVWLGLFALAQALRYWCMISLGRFWNTRILVIPGASPVRRGPYRWFKHPNYLGVAIELACVPLIFGVWKTALAASILNATLLLGIRIPTEEEALQLLEGNLRS